MKVVYSDPKTGLTAQKDVGNEVLSSLLGRRIGDEVDGSLFGLNGCKLKITGGSDDSGFGMDRSVNGAIKVQVFRKIANSGKHKGMYKRITVSGNSVGERTVLLNTVITDYGDSNPNNFFPKKEKEGEAESEKK